jgi:hypothetical protein
MRIAPWVLAALICAQEPAKTPIWWSLKKGQKLRYEFSHKLVTGDARRLSQIDLTLVVEVEGGDLGADRTNGMNLTIERVALAKAGHGDREDYDSARDKTPPRSSYPQVLSKCIGKKLAMRLGPSGNLVTYDQIQKMVQAAVDALPELKGREKWNADGVKVEARRIEWLLRLGFETPKGGPAAVGDTWETKYENDDVTRGLGKAVCKAKLKELKAGEAVIEQAVTFDLAGPLAPAIKEASGKGTLTWDTDGGFLKSLGATSKIVTIKGDAVHTVTVALQPPK